MRSVRRSLFLLGFLLLPTFAYAQTTLAGVVRDASGAVLPGVTVEASSTALIEKIRSAVSDGSGQYRITDLPPGNYSVAFMLPGFSKVVRDGLTLSGSGAITVDVELRLGGLEETLTVTGEAPVVDVQTTRRETVLSNDVLQSLPVTRSYTGIMSNIASLMPTGGVGAETNPGQINRFTAHGGRQNEGRISVNGLLVTEPGSGAGVSSLAYDVTNVDEIQVLVSGGLGEAETGGPIMNLVPRSGGNTFAGSAFYSGAGEWSRSNNVDDELRAIGILEPSALVNAFDVNGSLGGPILRDHLWFFGSARTFGQTTAVSGAYANLYTGDPTRWDYARDAGVVTRNASRYDIFSIRLTEQITPRNRVSFSQENQYRCQGSTLTDNGEGCRARSGDWIAVGNATNSPEAFPGYHDLPYYVTQATWSSPVSSRLLLDAGFSRFHYRFAGNGQVPPDGLTDLIPVTEQSTIYGLANFSYRGLYDPNAHAFADNKASSIQWRTTASYVTGAHNFKIGYMGSSLLQTSGRVANDSQLRYTFNNRNPVSFGYVLAPRWDTTDHTMTTALFAQDQWTLGKLTLQGAIRYDRAWSWAPAEGNGTTETSVFNPQPISFERTVSVKGYNDITPRVGAAYDVFGTGKTAIKANLGKYLKSAEVGGIYAANNPAVKTVTRVIARPWNDGNRNFRIDCNLADPRLQDNLATGGDRCAALGGNDLNFGNPNPNLTVIDPATLEGWSARESDWQFGVSVQQEVLPRVGLEVGYNRRWFQNFLVTDNLLVGPQDYQPWTLIAPQDGRLPDGGGYPVTSVRPDSRGVRTRRAELPDVRDQLRTGANVVLARRRCHGERAPRSGRDDPGRHEHRTRHSGPLRDGREHRQSRSTRVRGQRTVDHGGPRVGQLHGSESRRARERDLPFAAHDHPLPRIQQLGHQWCVARRQLQRAQHGGAGAARSPAVRLERQRHDDSEPRGAGAGVRGARDTDRHAVREGVSVRRETGGHRRGSLQPVQHQRSGGLRAGLRLRDTRCELAAADVDRAAAVRAGERDL